LIGGKDPLILVGLKNHPGLVMQDFAGPSTVPLDMLCLYYNLIYKDVYSFTVNPCRCQDFTVLIGYDMYSQTPARKNFALLWCKYECRFSLMFISIWREKNVMVFEQNNWLITCYIIVAKWLVNRYIPLYHQSLYPHYVSLLGAVPVISGSIYNHSYRGPVSQHTWGLVTSIKVASTAPPSRLYSMIFPWNPTKIH
jgi:hypothetical protein